MSDLRAQDYYNEMKEIVDVPDFTKLTSTGISPDYESIFDFAEAYFDARMEANSADTGDRQLTIPDVSNNEVAVCDYRDVCKYIAENGHCSIRCKHYGH